MKTYTQLRNRFGKLTLNDSSANLTFGDETINDELRSLYAKRDWPFLHRLRTATTVASTTFVPLPYDVDQVESVYVTVSSTRYNPKPAPSRQFWDQLHYSVQTSDIPEYWYVYNGQIGLWPRPVTAGNTISINAKIRAVDLNTADITTTTITSIAAAGTALVVNAGLTVQMAGFWIRPTFVTTVNGGDGVWYELSAVASTTAATLARPYGGLAIVAGSAACTIGQVSLLPEDFHELPVFSAASIYWGLNGDPERATYFEGVYQKKMGELDDYANANTDMVIKEGYEETELINPNLLITI